MGIAGQRYVSSELAHFVGRGLGEKEQYQILLKILNQGWITHPPHDPKAINRLSVDKSAKISANEMYSPQIVCFCDIPITDLAIHVAKYSPFGLSFKKEFIVNQGGCPVFYIPNQARVRVDKNVSPEERAALIRMGGIDACYERIEKGSYFDEMMQEYHALIESQWDLSSSPDYAESKRRIALMRFINFHIFSYIKFFDHSYDDDHHENYYLEREWRVIGNVKFDLNDVETVFMPKPYSRRFKVDCPSYMSQLIFL